MLKVVSVIIIFCALTKVAKSDEEQQNLNTENLYQHITTEIIDLPDDTAAHRDVIGQYRSSYSSDVMYPWPVQQNGANNNYKIPANVNGQYNVNANPYYLNTYSNQRPYPYNYGYQYRPFYPSGYVYRHYPSLYQNFPHGFYILPDTPNVFDTMKVANVEDVGAQGHIANAGNVDINRHDIVEHRNDLLDTTDKPLVPNQVITNYTRINERKKFVNHVELKPVSTKMTRYGGSDGKMLVKVVSSDTDGQEKITESEYTGNIDLKITNGVLETPKNASNERTDKVDPNSITAQINTRINNQEDERNHVLAEQEEEEEEEEKEEEKEDEENTKPMDITSWFG